MSRSSYKLPYVHKSFFPYVIEHKKTNSFKVNYKEEALRKKNVENWGFLFKRYSHINDGLVGKKIAVYNGNVFIIYNVSIDSVGFKLGEFSVTRIKPNHAGKIKNQKKVVKVQKTEAGAIPISVKMPVRKPKSFSKMRKKKGTLKKKKMVGKKRRK